MKKQVIFLLSFVMVGAILWTSCAPEPEPQRAYYNSYGTIVTEDNLNFTVLLDNGAVLVPEDLTIEDIANDSRALLGFYIESQDTVGGKYIINAEVIEMYNVYTLNVIQLTEELIDSVGNDGVFVEEENVWLSSRHLNVSFGFYGGGTVHTVNLVKPIGEQTDEAGNQILEFRHNKNGDMLSQYIPVTTSFYMESLHEDGLDSINFAFRAYDYDSVLTEVKGTYHFRNQQPAMKQLNFGPINFDPDYSYKQLQ